MDSPDQAPIEVLHSKISGILGQPLADAEICEAKQLIELLQAAVRTSERRAIANYYRRGATVAQTMRMFKCTDATVRACVKEAGYKMRPPGCSRSLTPRQELRVLELFKLGKSKSALARQFKVSRQTIIRTLVERGVEPVVKEQTADWPDDAVLAAQNAAAAELALSQPLTFGGSALANWTEEDVLAAPSAEAIREATYQPLGAKEQNVAAGWKEVSIRMNPNNPRLRLHAA